jgi:hypothetical protein
MLDVVLALALLVALLTYLLWRSRGVNALLPPGPSPLLSLPYVGHGYLLKEDPIGKLFECKETHGNIFRLDVGLSKTVFLAEYQFILEAAKAEVCSGRPYGAMSGLTYARKVDSTGNLGGTASSGKVWHEQRKFMLHNLSDLGMGSKDTMESVIAQEVEYLGKRIKAICGKEMAVQGFFLTAANNVIWRLITGKRTKQDEQELVDLIARVSKFFDAFDPGSLLFLLQLSNDKFLRLCAMLGVTNVLERLKPLYETVEKVVSEKKEDARGNIIERLLAEIARNKDNSSSSFHGTDGRVHLLGQMFDFLIAGEIRHVPCQFFKMAP